MANNKQKAIYVLEYCPSEGSDPQKEWEVTQWREHPGLAPHPGGKQQVSTAAGDVELCVPLLAERNYKVLGWAQQCIEQLHPHPDNLSLESMTAEALLRKALQMSLEYIALAEDGRGHNARSHYLARQLREIQQYMAQYLDVKPIYTKEENNG